MMAGPPLRLNIDPEATPVIAHKAASVPVHWEGKVKEHMDRDVRLGVIEKVPIGTPDTWCQRMMIVGKLNGEPRRVIDFQPLNTHATRETRHTKSPYHQARDIPRKIKKSVFDVWNGYHSVPLHSGHPLHHIHHCLGKILLPHRHPGCKASGDGCTARFDNLVENIKNKTKCVDDTLIWSVDIEQAFNDAVLCPDKFPFAQDTVQFTGFEISMSTVKPARKLTKAIAEFPHPLPLMFARSLAW